MNKKFVKYDFIANFASYLINNDASGLEEAEIWLLDHFLEINNFECVDVSKVNFWHLCEILGKQGDCLTYSFRRKDEKI